MDLSLHLRWWEQILAVTVGLVFAVLMVFLLVVLPIVVAYSNYSRAHPRSHDDPRCKACGYDLTGNESGICPECGNPSPEPIIDLFES